MATRQEIKQRIKSVTSTKKITNAMHLVAASKLKRAKEAATGPSDYVEVATSILSRLASTPAASYSPLFIANPVTKPSLVIAITSDRGLAGAYNSNINRQLTKLTPASGSELKVIAVGKYASKHAARIKLLDEIAYFELDSDRPLEETVQAILRKATELYTAGEVSSVELLYTDFISIVSQEVKLTKILPIQPMSSTMSVSTNEPDDIELINYASQRYMESQIMTAILESKASEQAARMVAMKNATDNASDLIEDFTLAYNNARQAAITQELAEISAGAEAING